MWYDYIDNPKALYNLYKEVPPLDDVRIASIHIDDEGNRIVLMFDMPRYPDFPSPKWGQCNTVTAEIWFTYIAELSINTTSNSYRGYITIEKFAEGLLEVSIVGNLNVKFITQSAFIQRIEAYLQG